MLQSFVRVFAVLAVEFSKSRSVAIWFRPRFAPAIAVWIAAFVFALGAGQLNAAAGVRRIAAQSREARSEGAAIRGKVVDANSKPVAGAAVRLHGAQGAAAIEVKSGTDGGFVFSGLDPGSYTLTAQSGPMRAPAVQVTAERGKEQSVVLVLAPVGGQQVGNAKASGFSEAMEFADKPSFTVAGVTDWTAAGGHGSDVNLRASEALVKEAVDLKPAVGTHESAPAGGNAPDAGADAAALRQRESDLHAAVDAAPRSFAANRSLAEFYLGEKRYRDALAPLEACFRINAGNRENERDLARALKESGDFAQARSHLDDLLAHGKDAELHRMAGEVDEALGDPLRAVAEFEQAARLEPSEENYFAWGSELLLHRAVLEAREVFTRGAKAYPASVRMLTALGAALFAGAHYDEAALQLCAASDLDPKVAEPYLFLGRIVVASPNPLPCAVERLARFAEIEPANPLAGYYYAMALWKQEGQPADATSAAPIESLLNRSVALDAKCAPALLQLGVLNLSRKDYAKAIDFFQKAIEADPRMIEAHYRLGMAYDRAGERDKAKAEFDLHEKLDKEQKEEVERQRRAIKQFRVLESERPSNPVSQP